MKEIIKIYIKKLQRGFKEMKRIFSRGEIFEAVFKKFKINKDNCYAKIGLTEKDFEVCCSGAKVPFALVDTVVRSLGMHIKMSKIIREVNEEGIVKLTEEEAMMFVFIPNGGKSEEVVVADKPGPLPPPEPINKDEEPIVEEVSVPLTDDNEGAIVEKKVENNPSEKLFSKPSVTRKKINIKTIQRAEGVRVVRLKKKKLFPRPPVKKERTVERLEPLSPEFSAKSNSKVLVDEEKIKEIIRNSKTKGLMMRGIRNAYGLTPAQFADILGTTCGTIYVYESNSKFSRKTAEKIAIGLEFSAELREELLKEFPENTKPQKRNPETKFIFALEEVCKSHTRELKEICDSLLAPGTMTFEQIMQAEMVGKVLKVIGATPSETKFLAKLFSDCKNGKEQKVAVELTGRGQEFYRNLWGAMILAI